MHRVPRYQSAMSSWAEADMKILSVRCLCESADKRSYGRCSSRTIDLNASSTSNVVILAITRTHSCLDAKQEILSDPTLLDTVFACCLYHFLLPRQSLMTMHLSCFPTWQEEHEAMLRISKEHKDISLFEATRLVNTFRESQQE